MVALGFGIGSVQCKEDKPTEFSCSHRPHNYAIQGNKSSAKWKPNSQFRLHLLRAHGLTS